ncbi:MULTISPECIES: phytoene desaturase family protein [Streptomycetaceae]|uniref:Putative dehydrogenase n=1 Tax=Streptantibioticus cattleyicolor (strain ATCC 35852 / DSM 46488 / JCM 4925 / NBRC 14057 / NRRL 8057) TaxID=1003195 RepID=F8JYJ4_STREN|nr:NAD(P)/FAD-dependent oxidoreductase [Streptantibioticus cattleyicolor]AEW97211.1 putative dehydrogenase [Streptantibioticus cattleyicolor NRRL 8057 = DSM 46488]MYS61666.1 NAD(P)-binding protein [Streptomyces sp. SID5468]CCB77534.1 Protein p49 [Streptantibioticus cattleyicolor NRRL 8057 = DSM 46488]
MTTDAVVVGAGPNGLTAAVELARAGLTVEVFEAAGTVGGGARTEELTLPGFRHDPCSTAHPFGAGSPVFNALPLARHGLEWVHPDLPAAHPFPDGRAAVVARTVGATAASLGPRDAGAYRRLFEPFTGHWDELARDFFRPQWLGLPRHPLRYALFGAVGAWPLAVLARRFHGELARGMLAGVAAHLIGPLYGPGTAGATMMFLLAAHSVGWPFACGGSQAISDALAAHLAELGGTVHTGVTVTSLAELPPARAYLFDTSPTALARIAGLRGAYRSVRYGPAAFKIDYALDGPVPWTSPQAARAGTVHLGASYQEVATALAAATHGRAPEVPFVLTAQPSLFDPTRAPAGKHVFWAYGHVPNGWRGDLTSAIERQIERFAPGFTDRVLARAVAGPAELAARNANYVGGDMLCGSAAGLRLLIRPVLRRVPYATDDPAVFLCSQATPPGPGVHGMSGHHAARTVLRRLGVRPRPLPSTAS